MKSETVMEMASPVAAESADESGLVRQRFARNLAAVMDLDDRIPPARGRARYLSEHLKVSHTTTGLWLAGDRLPDAAHLLALMKLLDCRFEELMLDPQDARPLLDESYRSIVCHGTDSLDGWSFYTLPEALHSLSLPLTTRMMRLESAEMAPFATIGDIVIYDTNVRTVRDSGIYVFRVNSRMVVRRAMVDLRGDVRLSCDNKDFAQESNLLKADDFSETEAPGRIQVLGKVLSRVLLNR